MDVAILRRWMRRAAELIHAQRDYLTQLDAAIGDADHGTNMDRGFTALVDGLDEGAPLPGLWLTEVGTVLFSKVGGASGALWGIALQRAGKALGDGETFDGRALATALDEALEGIVELGAAREGDKTIVDTLAPAGRAFRQSIERGAAVSDAIASACSAGEEGMRATVALRAAKGRASYLGDRSVGHQDPGATSTMLILEALADALTGA